MGTQGGFIDPMSSIDQNPPHQLSPGKQRVLCGVGGGLMRESGARDPREVGMGGSSWRGLCRPTGPKAGTTQNQTWFQPPQEARPESPEICTMSAVCFVASVVFLCDPMDEPCQAPLSMGLSRQEYWNRLPCPLPGDLLDPGMEPRSPALQAEFLPSGPPGTLSRGWF